MSFGIKLFHLSVNDRPLLTGSNNFRGHRNNGDRYEI